MVSEGKLLDGKYKIIKVLGKGGMGTVYLCENVRLNKLWAIKEIKKDINDKLGFLSEPQILKNLNHPGIPKILDIFYEEDNLYIVEDYIEGKTLKEYVREGNITGEEDMYIIMLEICSIIQYLHGLNPPIIYRDLKPSNIMITKEKKVVLVDFGIAKQYKLDNNDDTRKLGSNGYAAPEQYGSGKCCNRTDIYGAGMVLYFMISGNNPSTPIEPLVDGNYNEGVNRELKNIIQRCVQIEIKDRYESIEELKNDIKALEENNYEKTLILGKANKDSNKKSMNSIKNRYFIIFIAVILIAFTVVYFWYDYSDERKDEILSNKLRINDTKESLPKEDSSTKNNIDSQPVMENEKEQNDNSKSLHSKGKRKGIDKKKNKNTH